MPKPCTLPGLIAVAGLLLATPTLAGTWQWRDAAGRMVYSDLPPPADVRASQIIRGPRPALSADGSAPASGAASAPADESAARATGGTAARPAASASAAAAAPATWVEREQAYRKRVLEREEAAAKEREEREQAAQSARACQEARGALRTLESGLRTAVINADGEREVLDDRERARRIENVRKEMGRNCARAG